MGVEVKPPKKAVVTFGLDIFILPRFMPFQRWAVDGFSDVHAVTFRGRPNFRPSDRARANPALVRSERRWLSILATHPAMLRSISRSGPGASAQGS